MRHPPCGPADAEEQHAKQVANLEEQLKRFHTKPDFYGDYYCNICGKGFESEDFLEFRISTHCMLCNVILYMILKYSWGDGPFDSYPLGAGCLNST